MPIVFVHGVNTRRSADYDRSLAARDTLFQKVLLPTAGLRPTSVTSPYWGGAGADFAFGLASVPNGGEGAPRLAPAADGPFAPLAAATAAAAPDAPREDAVLLTLARHDFVEALDMVYAAASRSTAEDADATAALGARLSAYGLAHEQSPPSWLAAVSDDDAFLDRVQEDLAESSGPEAAPGVAPEAAGPGPRVWDRVREGADRLHREAAGLLGKPAWRAVRDLLIPTVPTFLGDVFVYLESRDEGERAAEGGPIGSTVVAALREAARHRTAQDPLLVIAHSLGGVIAYDVLSAFATDVPVDVLCTVGSQVALFEEMKVFAASDPGVTAAAGRTVAKPASVGRWINVFDYHDVLSYKIEPVFTEVVDYDYPSGSLLHAHGAYFVQPSFHRRLGGKVRAALR